MEVLNLFFIFSVSLSKNKFNFYPFQFLEVQNNEKLESFLLGVICYHWSSKVFVLIKHMKLLKKKRSSTVQKSEYISSVFYICRTTWWEEASSSQCSVILLVFSLISKKNCLYRFCSSIISAISFTKCETSKYNIIQYNTNIYTFSKQHS